MPAPLPAAHQSAPHRPGPPACHRPSPPGRRRTGQGRTPAPASRAIGCGPVPVDAQRRLGMGRHPVRAHGLTGLGPAQLHAHARPAGARGNRGKSDTTPCTSAFERFSALAICGRASCGHMAERRLNGVQDRQQRAFEVPMRAKDLVDLRGDVVGSWATSGMLRRVIRRLIGKSISIYRHSIDNSLSNRPRSAQTGRLVHQGLPAPGSAGRAGR